VVECYSLGGLAIAVPGEVYGLYMAWEMFGRLPWADLIQPTIDLCEQGFIVEADLPRAIKQYETAIRADPNLSYVYLRLTSFYPKQFRVYLSVLKFYLTYKQLHNI
jgi:gamma-glutamyltranspeptidase/glutathione hydrolase/leukotriene-C4 hydrolase